MHKDKFSHISDQELLHRYYAEKNNDWLGALFERYTLLLLGVCMKYLHNEEEAKDSVQQVFLKVITELGKYEVVYFKSWIYTVARNHCLMKLRDRQGKMATEISEKMMLASEEQASTKTYLEKDHLLENLQQAVEELNSEQKQCVKLFYLEKMTYQEIAGRTGYSIMKVKSHIQNGKRNLKLALEKKDSYLNHE